MRSHKGENKKKYTSTLNIKSSSSQSACRRCNISRPSL